MQAQRCVWLGKRAAVTAIAVVMHPAREHVRATGSYASLAGDGAGTGSPTVRRSAAKSQRRRDRG